MYSYTQGFIDKCAEYGVDSDVLFKLGKELNNHYETGGWAPPAVRAIGRTGFPEYYPEIYDSDFPREGIIPERATTTAVPLDAYDYATKFPRVVQPVGGRAMAPASLARARMAYDPKFNAWMRAHSDAVSHAVKPLTKSFDEGAGADIKNQNDSIKAFRQDAGFHLKNPQLMKHISDLYHSRMNSLTNGVPSAVSK